MNQEIIDTLKKLVEDSMSSLKALQTLLSVIDNDKTSTISKHTIPKSAFYKHSDTKSTINIATKTSTTKAIDKLKPKDYFGGRSYKKIISSYLGQYEYLTTNEITTKIIQDFSGIESKYKRGRQDVTTAISSNLAVLQKNKQVFCIKQDSDGNEIRPFQYILAQSVRKGKLVNKNGTVLNDIKTYINSNLDKIIFTDSIAKQFNIPEDTAKLYLLKIYQEGHAGFERKIQGTNTLFKAKMLLV